MVLEAIGTAPVTADVTIPSTATLGATRMRVSMQRGQFAEPCEDFLFGEVHDYEVVINNSFTLPAAENEKGLGLQIAPNPVNSRLDASFKLRQAGTAKLSIIAANGVMIFSEKRFYPSGNQAFSMDVSHLKSGPYMLFVQPEKQKAEGGRFMKVEE